MTDMIAQNKFFTATCVMPGVTRITGLAMECCYLVEGTRRALLIDGLTGIGSLRSFVRELTELPITVAITHAHMDHTGIAWESDEILLHPNDLTLLKSEPEVTNKQRKEFVDLFMSWGIPSRTKPQIRDVISPRPVWVRPIYDADVIDLGGVRIEVIAVPGHTRGSVAFLDRTHRIVYAGDACNANTLLNLEGSTSIVEYKHSLEHWWAYEENFDFLCSGHDQKMIPKKIILEGMNLCEQILAGTDDAIETNDPFGGKSKRAGSTENGGLCTIVYKPETIFETSSPQL